MCHASWQACQHLLHTMTTILTYHHPHNVNLFQDWHPCYMCSYTIHESFYMVVCEEKMKQSLCVSQWDTYHSSIPDASVLNPNAHLNLISEHMCKYIGGECHGIDTSTSFTRYRMFYLASNCSCVSWYVEPVKPQLNQMWGQTWERRK